MSRKIGLAFIGFGSHSQHHEKQMGSRFITKAVWDFNPDVAANHPKRVTTLEAALTAKGVDAVFIGSPEQFHVEQTRLALEAGKHVFCEKPLAANTKDQTPEKIMRAVRANFALAHEKDLVVTTCHLRRFDRPLEWLFDGMPYFRLMFGEPRDFRFDFSYNIPSELVAGAEGDDWKGHRSLLEDHFNHEIDLANKVFGACSAVITRYHDGFDYYNASGLRDDGITFSFIGTRRLEVPKLYHETCSVRFDRGEVVVDMKNGVGRINDHHVKRMDLVQPGLSIDYDGRLLKTMEAFADEIGGAPGYLTVAEMLMNTESCLRLAAAKNGQQVRIDLDKDFLSAS